MPRSGALTLSDLDADFLLRVTCEKCGRAGRLRVGALQARCGREAVLPDVLRRIAACPRGASMSDPCGAVYPDLATGTASLKLT